MFTVYDFSEKGTLLIDEITLAVKSTVQGLCKVSKLKPPATSEYESLSRLAFASCGKSPQESMSMNYLTLAEFLAYINASPTTSSWMGYYDDIEEGEGANDGGDASNSQPSNVLNPCPDFDDDSDAVIGSNGQLLNENIGGGITSLNGTKKKMKPTSGVGTWYRAPVIDESFVPAEGDETTIKYLDEGTPCYGALTELLKPEGKVK